MPSNACASVHLCVPTWHDEPVQPLQLLWEPHLHLWPSQHTHVMSCHRSPVPCESRTYTTCRRSHQSTPNSQPIKRFIQNRTSRVWTPSSCRILACSWKAPCSASTPMQGGDDDDPPDDTPPPSMLLIVVVSALALMDACVGGGWVGFHSVSISIRLNRSALSILSKSGPRGQFDGWE